MSQHCFIQKHFLLVTNKITQGMNLIYSETDELLSFLSIVYSSLNVCYRTQNCSIDTLSLKTNWKATANYSLVLTGLLIEGGILEETIKPCSKNSENITTAPDCYLSWVLEVSHLSTFIVVFPVT